MFSITVYIIYTKHTICQYYHIHEIHVQFCYHWLIIDVNYKILDTYIFQSPLHFSFMNQNNTVIENISLLDPVAENAVPMAKKPL